jgi:HK97 family phage portal protein
LAFWNRNRENRAITSGMTYPSEWLTESFSTGASPSGKRVTVQGALGVAPVWAAVSLIAEQVGQLPLKVYKQVDGDRVEARSHRAWSLLHDKPNEYTPADRFWATVTSQLLLYGNAFIRKYRDGQGLVDELVLMNPSHMIVYWDGDQRIKQYNYQPLNGEMHVFGPEEVLHIYGFSVDGVLGESVISRQKGPLGTAMARDEYEGGFYKRGATLSAVVEMDGQVKNPTALKRLKDSIDGMFGGSGKAHGVGVFEDGAKFRTVGSPMKDMEFVAAQQMSRTDIASMFHLPPNYLGGSSGDSLTYATVESNQIQFALHAIAPWTNTIAKAITADPSIFPQTVYDAEFVLDGMLRADAAARAAYYKAMADVGAMTPNEMRRLENLPPLPDGDVVGIPTAERISVKEDAPAPTPGETGALSAAPDPKQTAVAVKVNGNGNGAMPTSGKGS